MDGRTALFTTFIISGPPCLLTTTALNILANVCGRFNSWDHLPFHPAVMVSEPRFSSKDKGHSICLNRCLFCSVACWSRNE